MRYQDIADLKIYPDERQGKTIEIIESFGSDRSYSTTGRGGKRITQRKRRAIMRTRRRIFCAAVLVTAAVFFVNGRTLLPTMFQIGAGRVQNFMRTVQQEDYPQELLEMLDRNEENYDYVTNTHYLISTDIFNVKFYLLLANGIDTGMGRSRHQVLCSYHLKDKG